MNKPTEDQLEAVKEFKNKHGRYWKDALRSAWTTGKDLKEPKGHLLRQVRNQCADWLKEAKL